MVNISNIKLVIDNDVLDDYFEYYKSIHPRAKKKPITMPYHPSINAWCILPRMSMNNLKQKWKDFIIWFVSISGYNDLQLDDFDVKYVAYFNTNRRHDVDNQVPKFILDGLTESGMIVDDDDKHLHKLTLATGYDKDNPRAEITILVK